MLRDLNMRIDMDDRIALLGANGNGKSTLIKLLADKLSPQSGKLIKSRKLKIGYFAQHQTEELRPDITAYDHLNTLFPMAQSPVCEPNWDASVSCNQKQIPKCRTFLGERRRVFFSAS